MAFKFVDISDLTEGELIEIIEDNTKTAAFTREEIRKLLPPDCLQPLR